MSKIRLVICDNYTLFRISKGARGVSEREENIEVVGGAADNLESPTVVEVVKPVVLVRAKVWEEVGDGAVRLQGFTASQRARVVWAMVYWAV